MFTENLEAHRLPERNRNVTRRVFWNMVIDKKLHHEYGFEPTAICGLVAAKQSKAVSRWRETPLSWVAGFWARWNPYRFVPGVRNHSSPSAWGFFISPTRKAKEHWYIRRLCIWMFVFCCNDMDLIEKETFRVKYVRPCRGDSLLHDYRFGCYTLASERRWPGTGALDKGAGRTLRPRIVSLSVLLGELQKSSTTASLYIREEKQIFKEWNFF